MSVSVLENPEIRKLVLPITVENYHRFSETGLIPEKTELIEGVIIQKMTKSSAHSYAVARLGKLLQTILPAGYYMRKEEPLTLAFSEPEPDLAVVKGDERDYKEAHPRTALLVVEVAKSSLVNDREKIAIYARAGVETYWIVNLVDRVLETYSQSDGEYYGVKRIHAAGEAVPVFNAQIDSGDFFP